MSIKDAAFKFYEKIWDSPNRKEIREVVEKLKSSTRGHPNKIYPTPILGLLLYEWIKIKTKPFYEELNDWSDRERKILFGVHEQILQFNYQCLQPLARELPHCVGAVNPYQGYSKATAGFSEFLFRNEDAEEIIKSFHTHPAFKRALADLSVVKEHQMNYRKVIPRLESELIEAGPGGEAQWLTEYEGMKNLDTVSGAQYRHAAALVCLRDSLANLNQLIYQALFQEKLYHLNESHIIDYVWTTRGTGIGMWLMYLWSGMFFIIEETDLVFVSVKGLENRLYRIEAHFLPPVYEPGRLFMRQVDENLNCHKDLLH